jgi:hypothetical protein
MANSTRKRDCIARTHLLCGGDERFHVRPGVDGQTIGGVLERIACGVRPCRGVAAQNEVNLRILPAEHAPGRRQRLGIVEIDQDRTVGLDDRYAIVLKADLITRQREARGELDALAVRKLDDPLESDVGELFAQTRNRETGHDDRRRLRELLERSRIEMVKMPVRYIDVVRAKEVRLEDGRRCVPPGRPVGRFVQPGIDDQSLAASLDVETGVADDTKIHSCGSFGRLLRSPRGALLHRSKCDGSGRRGQLNARSPQS